MFIPARLLSPEYYQPLITNLIRIVLILVFAYVAAFFTRRLIRGLRRYVLNVMLRSRGGTEFEIEKRARTVAGVAQKSLAVLIWTIAAFMILKELNFDIRPLLAGAGVVGIAVGLGAQTLIKDVLAGLFLLAGNTIRVNDVAVINETAGLVEEVNLRTTVIRGEDGAVYVFPNGSINKLANLTRDFSYFVFSVSVAYSEDTDRVAAELRDLGAQLAAEEPFSAAILAPLEVLGVDKLADSGVIIKARLKTVPMKQWMVGREMNRRIKKRFEEAGIDMPFPTYSIELRQDLSPLLREELKSIVREVLQENVTAAQPPTSVSR